MRLPWPACRSAAATQEAVDQQGRLCTLVAEQPGRVREWLTGCTEQYALLAGSQAGSPVSSSGGRPGRLLMAGAQQKAVNLRSGEVFSNFEWSDACGGVIAAPIEPLIGHFRCVAVLAVFCGLQLLPGGQACGGAANACTVRGRAEGELRPLPIRDPALQKSSQVAHQMAARDPRSPQCNRNSPVGIQSRWVLCKGACHELTFCWGQFCGVCLTFSDTFNGVCT